MGRPIQKKMFGPLDGSDTTPVGARWTEDAKNEKSYDTSGNTRTDRSGINIPLEKARVPGGELDIGGNAAETPYILWQKSSRRFKVRTSDGDGFCKLVNNDGSSGIAEGEMVLVGFVNDEGSGVPIRKISGRKAYDFSSNAYTWYVAGDGSSLANRIVLTAI
jgi:hypothetical protein